MRVVALVVFIVALAAVARGQTTICEKYSALLGVSQAELMNETITSVAIAVAACGDCPTAGWFNGTYGNAGGANFLTNPAALNALIGKLMGFFGAALGCNSAAFTSIYGGGFQTDMTAVHANFQKRITKEAFEYFNQQVIDVLAGAGVENTDLFAVAKVLDGFRARATGATATNLVCQDPDCASSPFSVKVQPGYFNPAYLTATSGTVITFFKTDLSPHIITEANSSAVRFFLLHQLIFLLSEFDPDVQHLLLPRQSVAHYLS